LDLAHPVTVRNGVKAVARGVDIRVVSLVAKQCIVACAAFEGIVTCPAQQLVIARTAVEIVIVFIPFLPGSRCRYFLSMYRYQHRRRDGRRPPSQRLRRCRYRRQR